VEYVKYIVAYLGNQKGLTIMTIMKIAAASLAAGIWMTAIFAQEIRRSSWQFGTVLLRSFRRFITLL